MNRSIRLLLVLVLLVAAGPLGAARAARAEQAPAPATLVLIHGLGAQASIWTPLKSHLAGSFEVLTYELHGHGTTRPLPTATIASESRALSEWLQERGLADAVLVGHGLGGLIAMQTALQHPVRRLILLDAGPRQVTTPEQRTAIIRALREDYDRFVAYQYLDISEDPQIVEQVLDMALRTDSTSFVSLLLDSIDVDLSDALPQLDLPILLIGSEAFLPVAGQEREYMEHHGFGAAVDLQYRRLERTGHYLFLERPASVASLIITWLRSDQRSDQRRDRPTRTPWSR